MAKILPTWLASVGSSGQDTSYLVGEGSLELLVTLSLASLASISGAHGSGSCPGIHPGSAAAMPTRLRTSFWMCSAGTLPPCVLPE